MEKWKLINSSEMQFPNLPPAFVDRPKNEAI